MITIDPVAGTLTVTDERGARALALGDPEAFELLSTVWLRAGWAAKHVYSFTWLGRPIIQLPEDLVRLQEVLFRVQPDVIVETGVAHGGGVIFYASLCKLLGKGRVLAVEVGLRPHNRTAIQTHPLAPYITLIDGDSTDPRVVAEVRARVQPGDRVLVALDSSHAKAHVLAELDAYAPLVAPGSYIIAMEGSWVTSRARPAAAPTGRGTTPGRRPPNSSHDIPTSSSRRRRSCSTRATSGRPSVTGRMATSNDSADPAAPPGSIIDIPDNDPADVVEALAELGRSPAAREEVFRLLRERQAH